MLAEAYAGRPAQARMVVIPARMLSAEVGGLRLTTGGRVVLLAPPEGWPELLPGQQVRAEGLLAPSERADLTVAVLRVRGPPADVTEPAWWQRVAGTMRHGLRQAAGVLPVEAGAVLPGLAVGDTGLISASLREEFRTTGLAHLVAVSGFNVVIVCGAVLGLLRLVRAGPRVAAGGAGAALLGYVVLAGPSPSVLRAGVMGAVALLAIASGRHRSAVPALGAAVIGLLLVDPALGADPGFALSVLATAALVLLAPGWAASLRRRGVPPGIAEALAVPAAAHLVTAPVVAGLSGQVSLVAVAANLLVTPVVAPATVFGVLATVVSPLAPWAAEFLARLAGPELQWLVAVAHWFAGMSGAAMPWPSGLFGALLLVAVTLIVAVLLRRRRVRALVAAALVGLLIVLLPTRLAQPGWPVTGWAMVVCDVGQGDAVVLATADAARAVLVDAGPEPTAVDRCLGRLGVRALSLVVLSHLHADHVGGLDGALGGRAVGAVAVGPARAPGWAWREVARVASAHRVPVVALHPGQQLRWPGLELEVIGPRFVPGEVDERDGTAVNDTSVIIRAATAAGSMLLTGDVELAGQADLLSAGVDLRADVLKVPHHGSRFSGPEFLAAVRPRLALVSVGAGNRYGHPSGSVLDSLARGGALVRRTDDSGDIAVVGQPGGPAVVARGPPPVPRQAATRAGA